MMRRQKTPRLAPLALAFVLLLIPVVARGQAKRRTSHTARSAASYNASSVARDREIAARFAPVFYQGIGDHRRADLITNFDFDGDWRGDNNWAHAEDARFHLRAYVYYAVSETPTHLFVTYAVFHARDYKGSDLKGRLLSEAIREGVKRGGKYDPTQLSSDVVLAHENDLEGCLVVAAKEGEDLTRARVAYVETLAHDHFSKYVAEGDSPAAFKRVRVEGQRPLLYVEPKGHGVSAYDGDEREASGGKLLVYRFEGRAGSAEADGVREVVYELLPIYTTLWPRARRGVNETYASASDFGSRTFSFASGETGPSSRRVTLGKLGAAFRGATGAPNAARPPWGWFDRDELGAAPGFWFFDPAATVKRHFKAGEGFSTSYTHAPFLGVFRR